MPDSSPTTTPAAARGRACTHWNSAQGKRCGEGDVVIYRVLVTGSRRFTDVHALEAALLDTWHDTTQLGEQMLVVHGACYPPPDASGNRPYRSADWLTHLWCTTRGVQDEPHPADWRTHGRAAGPLRNQHMVNLGAHLVLAFPAGASTGTRDCTRRAHAAGIEVMEVTA